MCTVVVDVTTTLVPLGRAVAPSGTPGNWEAPVCEALVDGHWTEAQVRFAADVMSAGQEYKTLHEVRRTKLVRRATPQRHTHAHNINDSHAHTLITSCSAHTWSQSTWYVLRTKKAGSTGKHTTGLWRICQGVWTLVVIHTTCYSTRVDKTRGQGCLQKYNYFLYDTEIDVYEKQIDS